jgi:hypothetical protein
MTARSNHTAQTTETDCAPHADHPPLGAPDHSYHSVNDYDRTYGEQDPEIGHVACPGND